jgi:FkbM family methyltransferase
VVAAQKRKVGLYIRALTAERAAKQRQRLERHAADRGWEIAGVYEDVGTDGRLGEQPSLARALDDAGRLDALMVVKLDRLGRSVEQTLKTLKRLIAEAVALVSLDETLDTGESEGRVAAKVLAEIGSWQAGRAWSHGSGWDTLRKHEFAPATVIDVGAANGTHDLYAAFPSAYHVLIEPLEEFERPLDQVLERYEGERLATAVGSVRGSAQINVDPSLLMSSMLPKVRTRPEQAREVPVTTLDALLAEKEWSSPFGVKIDTEGFEHQVVNGATLLLERTQFVIAEVSVSKRFEHSYSAGQLIELVRGRGFEVADILDAGASALGVHADLLFVPVRPRSG